MATVVNELVNVVRYRSDGLKSVERGLRVIQGAATLLAGAAAAGSAAIGAMALKASDEINQIARDAQDARVSMDSFQAIAAAVRSAGGEAEDARAALAELSLRAQEALEDPGGSIAERFERYGIAVANANGQLRSTEDLLMDVADASKVMEDAGQSAKFLQDELIGDTDAMGLAPLLRDGAEAFQAELDRVSETRFFLAADDVEGADRFRKTLGTITGVTNDLFLKFSAGLLPAISRLSEGVTAFIAANRDIIEGRIQQAIQFVTDAVEGGYAAFMQLSDVLGGVDRVFMVVGAGAAALAVAFFGPVVAAGAVATAIVLLINDLMAWANGADSIVGRFLGPFENMPAYFQNLFDIVGDTMRGFVDLIDAIFTGDLNGIMSALIDILTQPARLIANAIGGLIDAGIALVNEAIESIPFLGDLVGGPIEFSAAETLDGLVQAGAAGLKPEETADIDALAAGAPAPALLAAPVEAAVGSAVAREARPAGDTNIATTLQIQNVTVPEGTTQEQTRAIMEQVEPKIAEAVNRASRQAVEDYPESYAP